MKILIVSQHFYPETFRINDMAFSLSKLGHSITVLTGLPNYPRGIIENEYRFFRKRDEIYQGVRIIRTPIIARGHSLIRMGLNYLSFAINASIKAFFIKEQFDVVFVFQTSPVSMILPGIVVQRKQRIPLSVYCLDQWPISVTTGPISEKSMVYKFLYRLSRWHYKQANLILLSSYSFIHYFENVLKLDQKDYGLNYWPSYAEDVYGNTQWLDNENFDCVFAGNIGPAQSVETIIEAAQYLKNIPSIRFHIVGDGLNLAHCKALALHYDLNNLVFYGHHPVEEMTQFYTLADAFLITMVDNMVVNSTLPAKLQSYQSAAKPILGAINGEVKRIIEEAECGWVCSSQDAKTLSKLIIEASQNPNLLRQKGDNGLHYYQKHFKKSIQLETLINHLQENCYAHKTTA